MDLTVIALIIGGCVLIVLAYYLGVQDGRSKEQVAQYDRLRKGGKSQ